MCRYVRQDDPKFEMLHKGVLSGSTVVGATGLCEDSTSKFIPNWPAFMVRSAQLILASEIPDFMEQLEFCASFTKDAVCYNLAVAPCALSVQTVSLDTCPGEVRQRDSCLDPKIPQQIENSDVCYPSASWHAHF